jgi:hypothetical protein
MNLMDLMWGDQTFFFKKDNVGRSIVSRSIILDLAHKKCFQIYLLVIIIYFILQLYNY